MQAVKYLRTTVKTIKARTRRAARKKARTKKSTVVDIALDKRVPKTSRGMKTWKVVVRPKMNTQGWR